MFQCLAVVVMIMLLIPTVRRPNDIYKRAPLRCSDHLAGYAVPNYVVTCTAASDEWLGLWNWSVTYPFMKQLLMAGWRSWARFGKLHHGLINAICLASHVCVKAKRKGRWMAKVKTINAICLASHVSMTKRAHAESVLNLYRQNLQILLELCVMMWYTI